MKSILLIFVMLLSIPTITAQKKEIKRAQQEVRAKNYASAQSYLDQAKRIFAAADSKTRANYYVVEAELKLHQKELDAEQVLSISQSINLAKRYEVTQVLQERIAQIHLKIDKLSASIAAKEYTKKNYANAASLYKTAYESSRDEAHLLKAARCYLKAEVHHDAFQAYSSLLNKGYTNAKTQYVATNVKTNKKEAFSSISKRDKAVSDGLYKNPEVITTNSKLPEILRGLTVAAIPLNRKHEALAFIDKEVAKMSENKQLLNLATHLYKQLEAYDKYNTVIEQLIKQSPNDPSIYYNAAVTSAAFDDTGRAKELYKKSLAVDPTYTNSSINLAELLLAQDKSLKEKMNQLGTSEADEEQYKNLKLKRRTLYTEVLPYLQSIVKAQPNNEVFTKKLNAIYGFMSEGNTAVSFEEEN